MYVSASLLREEEEARDLGQAASPRIHGHRYATRPWPPLTLGSTPAACHSGKHLGNPLGQPCRGTSAHSEVRGNQVSGG
ncbi:hypothetical protein MTO96_024815 [Rhipicephalus appendiculatus]